MNKIHLFITIIFFSSALLKSQDETADFDYSNSIELTNVYAFSPNWSSTSDNPEGWVQILNDDGSTLELNDQDLNRTQVWTQQIANIKPAAYVSNYNGQFGAHFRFDCDSSSPIYVRGEAPEGYHMPIQELISDTETLYRYRKKLLSTYENGNYVDAPFEKEKVQYWKDFTITWFVSDEENLEHSKWKEIGKTAFPLYVTHKEPIETNPNDQLDIRPTKILHTTISTACKGGNNKTIDSEIISHIYNQFTNQCVKKVDNAANEIDDCLGYWQPAEDPECMTVSEFVLHGNARCDEWADFFYDMLKVNGITSANKVYINYKNGNLTIEMFKNLYDDISDFFGGCVLTDPSIADGTIIMVKEHSINSNNKFYLDEAEPIQEVSLCNGNNIKNSDETGISAQGVTNTNPQSIFFNHAIIENNGTYYDPSYGSDPRTSKIDYEDETMDAFGISFRMQFINSQGGIENRLFIYILDTNNIGTLECDMNP